MKSYRSINTGCLLLESLVVCIAGVGLLKPLSFTKLFLTFLVRVDLFNGQFVYQVILNKYIPAERRDFAYVERRVHTAEHSIQY